MTDQADSLPTPDWPITDAAIRDVFDRMLGDGSWGRYHGPHCDALRDALAKFHGVEHVLLTSSGTSAVELSLRAAQVKPGDEVILCAYDYKANFANVLTLGAKPVLVDSLPGVPVPDVAQIATAITDKTKAIICSHLHGCFAPVVEIRDIAKQHGVVVIEDTCQATGAELSNHMAGSLGDIGVLSFGGSKLLTAGRGGAVLTNDSTLAQRIRLYTQRGNDAYPLSEMQAAVLLPQLKALPERTQQRLRSVRQLLQNLDRSSPLQPALDPDPRATADRPGFYKVAFRFNAKDSGEDREAFTMRIRQQGVAIDPAFPALHLIHGTSRFRKIGDLTHATRLHDELVTLHHPVLLEDIDRATAILNGSSGR